MWNNVEVSAWNNMKGASWNKVKMIQNIYDVIVDASNVAFWPYGPRQYSEYILYSGYIPFHLPSPVSLPFHYTSFRDGRISVFVTRKWPHGSFTGDE